VVQVKRNPLPPRSKPLVRVAIKRPRIATFERVGEIGDGSEVVEVRKVTVTRHGALKSKKRKPTRFGGVPQNPKYLAFVRCFACILSGLQSKKDSVPHSCSGKIEAAHTGRRGLKQKAADETALPMCTNGHRTGKFSHHRLGKNFWKFWGLDQLKLTSSFNEMARESEVLVQEYKS
jgi:hypothetical protein